MDITFITGIVASIMTALASIPQLIKLIKTKDSEGISFLMIGVLVIGLATWVYYGYLKNDYIIMVANSIPCLVNLAIGIIKFRLEK